MSRRGGTKRKHGSAAGSCSGGGGGDHSKDKQQQQVGERRRKRPRPPIDPATLPRFLDSTGSVTAGTYSARRLPEMKSLWRSFLEHKHAKSDERIAAAAAAAASAAAEASTMAGASRTAAGASAAELLDDSWNYRSGGRKASDRHLRRRTGSHNRRRKHRFPRGLPSNNNDAGDGDDEKQAKSSNDKPPCRRARRKPAVLREAHRGWQRRSSSLSPPTARNWIETHLWHTKRFHMSPPMFGWCIPLVHTGRGTAAALRLARDGCTVQDATWSIDGGASMLTSSTLDGLIAALGRVCGAQAEFSSDKMVLAGHQWGEGTVHKLDAYPLGVIGPARFLFCRQDECICVATFVHPSIRREVDSMLFELVSHIDEDEGDKVKIGQFNGGGGVALIRVRGEKATEAIKASLRPSPLSSSSSFNWVEISKSSRAHRIVPHGTVVPVEMNPTLPRNDEETDSNKGSSSGVTVDGEPENNLLSYVDGLLESMEDTAVETLVPTNHFNGGRFAMLMSHRPSNVAPQLKHNGAVCGWDILCSPGTANDIFLALNHRGACAIGLAEEASAALEAEPPIPVFPRDFPDTETGEAYWSCQDAAWNVVRCCLEQGALGGRFKTELKRIIKGSGEMNKDINAGGDEGRPDADESEPKSATCELSKKSSAPIHPFGSVEWESIATPFSDDESKDTRSVVAGVEVVRGAFGAPFVQALHNSGHFVHPEAQDEGTRTRRPRRRVRPAQMAIQANPLTEEEANAHESLCEMLLSSLSLPALIRCHISVEGRGTLEPRAAIYRYARRVDSMKDNSFKLGFIVAGAFSNNRGAFHGTAFVGAARLLQSLIDTRSSNTVSVIDPTGGEGQRKVALRVLVKSTAEGTVHRSALLTLML